MNIQTPIPALALRVESAERLRWHDFYADRTRPCPFFGSEPDENLVEWVRGGLLQAGAALDIGCGNGRNATYLASAGFRAQGVDLSEQAIAWARERAAAGGVHMDFVCGSIFDNVPAPKSFEFLYDSGCFHHLVPHQRDQYVTLVARALKPGGHFGLVCFAPEGGSGYSDEQIYQEGSLGGGLGYTEELLRDLWGKQLRIVELRRMNEAASGSATFGKNFLWVMLALRAA